MTATVPRSIHVRNRAVPVVLPNRRDPRLHTAAVILSVHAIGIIWLGFEVSVPQILAAILTAAIIDVAFTYTRTRSLVWPASGMLTGSGVALILRYVPTSSGQYWSWDGWYWFAGIAGVSILTKYLVRWHGTHVFNPSNIGLVAAFLIIGRETIEPLDFWWAPLDLPMIVAYAVIIGGGIAITRRLHLLEMAGVFWVTFVAGMGVLAASGHCMVATWSTTPVCDGRFWTTLATSPEVLVFLFFMITDPKTIPLGRTGRFAFAATLAVAATIFIAPQTLEYGAKVALLGTLVLWSPLRWVFDRALGVETARSGLEALTDRLTSSRGGAMRTFGRGMALGAVVALVAVGIVVAGSPARSTAVAATATLDEPPIEVDIGEIPAISIDKSLSEIDLASEQHTIVVEMLLEDLALEAAAVRTVDANLLAYADGGERLVEMQAHIDDAVTTGDRIADQYRFDSVLLRTAGESEGQTSAALAIDAVGTVGTITYDANGIEINRISQPTDMTFILRQLAGNRWLIVKADNHIESATPGS